MSIYSNYTYDSDLGTAHRLRAKSTLVGTTPPNPSGVSTNKSNVKVKISKSNREFGIRPRGVVLRRSAVANVNGESYAVHIYHFLPILNKATYDGTAFADGASVTYDGESWEVISRKAEKY